MSSPVDVLNKEPPQPKASLRERVTEPRVSRRGTRVWGLGPGAGQRRWHRILGSVLLSTLCGGEKGVAVLREFTLQMREPREGKVGAVPGQLLSPRGRRTSCPGRCGQPS